MYKDVDSALQNAIASAPLPPIPPPEQRPKMWPNPKLYRTRLVLDVLRIFVLPAVVLEELCHASGIRLGLLKVPAYLLAIVLSGFLRNTFYDIKQAREARRLGAKPITRIRGKWPGNIDILFRMMKAFKTAYLMDVYLELFQEYKCTTLNTRILWVDQVCSLIVVIDVRDYSIAWCGCNVLYIGDYHGRRTYEICPCNRLQQLLARKTAEGADVSVFRML